MIRFRDSTSNYDFAGGILDAKDLSRRREQPDARLHRLSGSTRVSADLRVMPWP
jgi:hypothetical protein